MPKETFGDVANSNVLIVKWGVWGTVEIATETKKDFPYPFNSNHEYPEMMRGWWLSLSKDDLKRLIKTLKRAYKQYDDETFRENI